MTYYIKDISCTQYWATHILGDTPKRVLNLETYVHRLIRNPHRRHASSIPRVFATQVLWAFEFLHVRSADKIPRLLDIPIANGPTPIRAHVVPVRLQNVLLPLKTTVVDRSTDVAHRNGESAFPAGTLSPRVCPLVLEC